MNLRGLFEDENAVSPVIGVILMVAITVILAAVIGTFVLGLGDQVQTTTPQANFNTDYTADLSGDTDAPIDALIFTHTGGDSIPASELNVTVNGASSTGATNSPVLNDGAFGSGTDVTAGTSWNLTYDKFVDDGNGELDEADGLDLSGATVNLVWKSPNGDSSATLKKWDGPSA